MSPLKGATKHYVTITTELNNVNGTTELNNVNGKTESSLCDQYN